jgi:hypothetical protein
LPSHRRASGVPPQRSGAEMISRTFSISALVSSLMLNWIPAAIGVIHLKPWAPWLFGTWNVVCLTMLALSFRRPK